MFCLLKCIRCQRVSDDTQIVQHFVESDRYFPNLREFSDAFVSLPALLSAVYGNGFQMVVSGPQAKPIKDAPIISLQVTREQSRLFA